MKLSIELEVNENVDPVAVHQLLHWAKQVERSAAGQEIVEVSAPFNSLDVADAATPPGISVQVEPKRRGRPRKEAAAEVAPVPQPVATAPPVIAVPPQQQVYTPPPTGYTYQPPPVFSAPVAMPPATPMPPSADEMSLDEFRAVMSAGQAQRPKAWFDVAKLYGYFTFEAVPAERRRFILGEFQKMVAQGQS